MAEIDVLEVKIKANAQSAAASLNNLSKALRNVRSSLSSVTKDGDNVTQRISKGIKDLNNSISNFNSSGAKKLNAMADALRNYADALKQLKGLQVNKSALNGIANVQDALSTRSGTAAQSGASAKVDQTAESIRSVGDAVEEVGEKSKKSTGLFGRFMKSIGRIMLYRAIRSSLKAIGDAFDEGLKNAYGFSQASETFKRLADSLDRIKSKTSQMVNQLGALWGELKQYVMPALEWIIEKVRWLGERLTEFFAALNGQPTYQRALLVAKSWGDATDAVKKYKQQLLGLDELNNLTTNQGGKGDETDYSTLYEEVGVNKRLSEVVGNIKDFTIGVGDILFNWDDLDGTDIAQKVITGIGGLLGGVVGFEFGGVPGAIVGSITGILFGAGIAKMLFDNETTYGKVKLRKLLYPALGALTGGWIGYKTSGLAGALVGMTVGATIGMLIEKFGGLKDKTSLSKDDKWGIVETALVGLTGGIIGFTLGGVSGAMVGASLAISLDLIFQELHVIDNIKDKITMKILDLEEEWGIDLNGDGTIGYKRVEPVKVGTQQLDNLDNYFMPFTKEPTVQTPSAHDLTLQMIDSAIRKNKNLKEAYESIKTELNAPIDASWLEKLWNDTLEDLDTWASMAGWYDIKVPFTGKNVRELIDKKAHGGVVSSGSYFLAGEAGPEFVGSIGGTSAVANTSQMTDAIYKAAYMGMSQALKENGGNGLAGFEPASTDDLFIAMRRKASKYNKTTGNSAFA